MTRFIRSSNKKILIFSIVFLLAFSAINISTTADEALLPDLTPYSLVAPEIWEEGEEIEIILFFYNLWKYFKNKKIKVLIVVENFTC